GDLRVFGPAVGSEKRFSKLFLQGSSYVHLPLGLTYVTSARIGLGSQMGSSEPLPLQERYFAGGDSTVRGFGQDLLGSCEAGTLVPIRSASHPVGGGTASAGGKSPPVHCDVEGRLFDVDVDGTTVTFREGELSKYQPLGGQALVVLNN